MKTIRIAVSPCLLGRPVRYDGTARRAPHLSQMFQSYCVEWIPTCPELSIGLGVPRPPIRHELQADGSVRLIMPERNRLDLTKRMLDFVRQRVEAFKELNIHGCVFKSRSPTCGIDDVEIYHPDGQVHRNSVGFFPKILRDWIPHIPVTDERRLLDPEIREQWWIQVMANV